MIRIKKEKGFSLIELMIVVALIAIMVAISVPSILAWLPSYRLKAATQDMVGNFQKAKLNAIKGKTLCTVVFNQTVDGVDYDYVVFVDDPANDNWMEYDAGEEIIARVRWEDYRSVELDDVTFANNDDGKPAFAFKPDGFTMINDDATPRPKDYGGVAELGYVSIVSTTGKVRQVAVSMTGNVKARG